MIPLSTGYDVQLPYVKFAVRGVVEKLVRLLGVIERSRYDAPHPHVDLFANLQKRVELELAQALNHWFIPLVVEGATTDDLASACADLQNIFSRIRNLHREVVYWISGPWAPRYIEKVLLRACEEALGTSAAEELNRLSPVVAQVGLYDFLADYNAGRGTGSAAGNTPTAVWAIPSAEVQNPLAWVMLFHEVAHTLIVISGVLPDSINELKAARELQVTHERVPKLTRYITELLADRIAADIAGPAYYAALSTFVLLERHSEFRAPNDDDSIPYPPARERVQAIELHLSERLGLSFDLSNELDMTMASGIRLLCQGRSELDARVDRPAVTAGRPEWLEECPGWEDVLEHAYAAIIRKYEPPRFTLQRESVRLSKRLASDLPIGSSHNNGSRDAATRMIQEKPLSEMNAHERSTLFDHLKQRPNSPRAVMNAAWIVEVNLWRDQRRDLLFSSRKDVHGAVEEIKLALRQRDDLVANSLDTLLLHSELADVLDLAL